MIRRSLSILLVLCAACSGSDGDQPKSASTHDKRDTAIKHEECDGNSSDAQKVDVNGDGKPDIIHVMKGGKEVCRIVDLNLDGAIDAFIYYDDQGRERRREADFDRDGRADEISIFEGGQIKLKMRETNFDNKIDTWDYYEGGRLVKRERDSDGDSIIDQWWQFNNPQNDKCAIVASDRNGDGKPDPESVVDLCNDSYGANKGVPGAGSAPPPAASSAAPPASVQAPPLGGAVKPPSPPASASAPPPAPQAPPPPAPSPSQAPPPPPKK